MDKDNESIVILFANISESAHLYDRMGDTTATNLIKKCLSLIQEIAQEQMGDVINIFGDKVNCVFWDATSAVLAAKGMNEAIENYIVNDTDSRMPINLHIGIHSGPVQKEENKLFGDTVNTVAIVNKTAKSREILITEQVFNGLESELKPSAQYTATIRVKGNSSPLNLYEYIWEDIETTVAIDKNKLNQLINDQDTCLELTSQNQTYEISTHTPRLKLGRQSQNDLVIGDKSASRFHASIELKNDKFVLSDHSTNGTFVYPQDGKSYSITQTKTYLEGTGALCLGEDSGLDSPIAIHYRIKDAT
ncbi:MAG: adenylate/guanylate cyclase domain-containing protein [Desulfobacterales bacterium]|nr:adenylate/guanylate cyclase domain-containing protein [Desulfobacterales bacterium]MDX2513482.1 adenylate/guanylate cyclase domain-containing protein [Desulfobacterales bacterium]